MNAKWPSRYLFSSPIEDGGRLLLAETNLDLFRFRDRPDNVSLTVRDGMFLWHAAHVLYGESFKDAGSLSWVLAYFNDLPDQTLRLVPGSVLVGPSVRTLREQILVGRRR